MYQTEGQTEMGVVSSFNISNIWLSRTLQCLISVLPLLYYIPFTYSCVHKASSLQWNIQPEVHCSIQMYKWKYPYNWQPVWKASCRYKAKNWSI